MEKCSSSPGKLCALLLRSVSNNVGCCLCDSVNIRQGLKHLEDFLGVEAMIAHRSGLDDSGDNPQFGIPPWRKSPAVFLNPEEERRK